MSRIPRLQKWETWGTLRGCKNAGIEVPAVVRVSRIPRLQKQETWGTRRWCKKRETPGLRSRRLNL